MRWAALLLPAALLCAVSCHREAPAGGFDGLAALVHAGETPILARVLPDPPGGLVAVVRLADGHEELRIAERRDGAWASVHAGRPGDEFRDLEVRDLNGDGRPEVATRWAGGQLEIVEVLGRARDGTWRPLLQNAGQVIEERRRPDGTVAFWLTSRTYEEGPGQPPVYDTLVYAWDGRAFTEVSRPPRAD